MRNRILLSAALLYTLSAVAVERVSLDSLRAHWERYMNQQVVISTPLVVCGNYYDSLVLAPERLRAPEERAVGLAEGDSTNYFALRQHNHNISVCLHCRNNYYRTRTGDRVRFLKARVTSPRQLITGKTVRTKHTSSPSLPRKNKKDLRVAGANIENYFADLGGYAHRKTTPSQQTLKTRKIAAAMKKMNADIFALCEMQQGSKAPQMLLAELNKHRVRYDFVTMTDKNDDRISSCFIFRKDRVKPYQKCLSACRDSTDHYHTRMIIQGFEDITNGGKLIISLNHFKSKRAGRSQYDTNDRRMQNTDSLLASLPYATVHFGDEDILLLGDYNCYTAEQPIRTIVRSGYADQLMLFNPSGYSYSYHSETGYLDRCFASPSMAAQIKRVFPWHVNADWYYSHGAYKLRDKSLHRYSDHDPIIVDIRLRP